MAQVPLAPPPPEYEQRWMFLLYKRIKDLASAAWSAINFTGSNITDIVTRNHADLQNINTASYTHLTSTQATDLTDAGDSALHYHATDRTYADNSVSTHAAITTGVHGLAITAGQTLTVATGGTLGSAAYTASTAYDAAGAASSAQAASQPVDAQLTAIAALADSAGWLHNDGAGTFAYSTPTGASDASTAARVALRV